MAIVQSKDAEIYYESHGEGPAVVFAHGRGGNATVWFQQTAHFAQRYRVVVFDHRTFGRSVGGGAHFNQPQLAEDLMAVLDALGIQRAALVAQSMGGWTGLYAAIRYPERVSCLVMTSTIGGLYSEEIAGRVSLLRSKGVPLMERVFGPGFPDRRPEMALLYHQIQSFNTGFDPRSIDALLDPAQALDLETLKGYAVPTRFIAAAEDRIFKPEVIRMAAALVPGAEVVDFPGAGHSPYWEDPELYNRIVGEFLERHHGG